MGKRDTKTKPTISGKSFEEVRRDLLRRALTLKTRILQKYDDLYTRSSMDHVRFMLEGLKKEEDQDTLLIKKALETGVIEDDGNDVEEAANFQMLDHLIRKTLPETNPNDLKSVLLAAIKTTDDVHNLFELMSTEYSGTSLDSVLRNLADHEKVKKERLSELYDDLVNKDYW